MAVTPVQLPGKQRPCARQQRRANRTGQFVPVLWLAAALLGSAGIARLHFGVSEPLHGQALVVSLQKTRAAVERAKPAARAAQSRKTKSPLPPLRPQKSLMKLVNRKLKRRATFNDTLFEVVKQDEKKGYLVRATLVFLPGCPSKTGGWSQDLKEAEDSAARAILKDPFLSAALDKPVQNLHNLVSKFHRRPPSAEDVKYTVREESVEDGQAQFVASVHLSTFPGNLSLEGRPRVNETKARWSAAEAMLLNPKFQATISKPEKPAWEQLHEMMTTKVRSLGRAMTSEDIVYTVEEREDMPVEARFRAKLRLQYLPMAEVAGRAQRSKALAKEAAASAFLSDPVAGLLLSPDPVSALRDQVNRRLRRKTSPDDIVYTVTQEPLKKGRFSFQASVALPCLKDDSEEEEIKVDGAAAATKVEARMKAAEALLLDPNVQQLLFPLVVRSRVLRACNAAEVKGAAVAQVEH